MAMEATAALILAAALVLSPLHVRSSPMALEPAMAPVPPDSLSPLIGPHYFVLDAMSFLNASGCGTFANVLQNSGAVDVITAGIAAGESFTILAIPDAAYGEDPLQYSPPDYCKSGRNADVDFATVFATAGLHVLRGGYMKSDLRYLTPFTGVSYPYTSFPTLTPVPLYLLPTPALVKFGLVNGFGDILSSVYLDTDIWVRNFLVIHLVTGILDYPQVIVENRPVCQ